MILGLLGALVVPILGSFSVDAKTAALRKELSTVRNAIALYQAQHGDRLPGAGDADFVAAITGVTDYQGNVAEPDKDNFGPYLSAMPVNPFSGLNSVDVDGTVGDDSHGWHFCSSTGRFRADSSGESEHGAHSSL